LTDYDYFLFKFSIIIQYIIYIKTIKINKSQILYTFYFFLDFYKKKLC
jgi:hypothetical protein